MRTTVRYSGEGKTVEQPANQAATSASTPAASAAACASDASVNAQEVFQELLADLRQGVVDGDETRVEETARRVVDGGFDCCVAVRQGLVAGMAEVGRLFAANEYFVPEVLICADSLYKGLGVLSPRLQPASHRQARGTVVIGTVEGDVHDIGKNLVKMLLEIAGFTVYDMGRNVSVEKFAEEVTQKGCDFLCLSALMTTTMGGIERVIEQVRSQKHCVKILVGGAPITQELARRWGADGYSRDAFSAIAEFPSLQGVLITPLTLR